MRVNKSGFLKNGFCKEKLGTKKKQKKKADSVDFVKKQVPVPCAFARRLIGNTRETGTSSE